MPGSWNAESITKTQEDHERDIKARKGTAQHYLKEFHHLREICNILSLFGEAQPQSLRKTEPSPTTEKTSLEETPQLRLIEDILQRLSELNEKKEIAEEKVNRLTKKVMDMEHKLSSHMALASKAKELAEENRVLREQLNDAQSHIFSLQPYRKDLTPEEVRQDYDALIEQIQDWVQKLMNPWLEDCGDDAHTFLTHTRRRIVDADRFKRILREYPDLMNGLNFPETDEDIVTSVILRYLHVRVFQSVLYDAIPRSAQTISFIENHMRASVEPKRNHFTVRTWTAEAYNTLLSCPQFEPVRQRKAKEMALQLFDILRIFSQGNHLHSCYQDLINVVVYPAIRLYEKLQISTTHFYLDITSLSTSVSGELRPMPRLTYSLMRLDCKNVLQNRKVFNLRKLNPPPSEEDLYHNLHSVCTVVPALYMRHVGQGNALKSPIVIRKQQILVAWGSEEQRRAYQENGHRTLISHLFAFKSSTEG
ncbi:hypothetical protein FMUND_7534 [Fusarium mundagurra]|uniref:Uncharacterized protein n=1 Tax=Fusarium mundagurra TaxID=1567541 RepID=A0A8H5YKU5_9HYPO|nr:hypothetical protein FMUND_7534 [Fusarium mundagurra]